LRRRVRVRTRIKFCGCTSARDADAAVGLGVDAVGVIFAPASPRRVDPETARLIARAVPAFVSLIGVFVEPAASQVHDAVAMGYVPQFSGNEPAWDCEDAAAGPYIKVYHLAPDSPASVDPVAFERFAGAYAHATWMFDTAADGKHGGTGRSFDWERARAIARARPVIVSGGLTPDTVGACVRRLRPYGVDVRSGIETDGVKDLAKMRAFVRAVKEADEEA
jgi:phosphoribosylanthranilate isomerase